jgi:type 1 fimbriae regulatory protein FimB/type 1 fimbriae regulatory protein FimE
MRRAKHGIPSVHPLRAPELRALRQLQRELTPSPYLFVTDRGSPMTAAGFHKILTRVDQSPYLFVTDRGSPMTAAGFHKILTRVAQLSSLSFSVHPHMLRHACGYKLVNEGHDTRSIQHYLGHKNIEHTVRYTELAASCFQEFWQN